MDRELHAPQGFGRGTTTATSQFIRFLADVVNNLAPKLGRESNHSPGEGLAVAIARFGGVQPDQLLLDVSIDGVPSLRLRESKVRLQILFLLIR